MSSAILSSKGSKRQNACLLEPFGDPSKQRLACWSSDFWP